jgi:hypothetical protein
LKVNKPGKYIKKVDLYHVMARMTLDRLAAHHLREIGAELAGQMNLLT